MEIDCFNVCQVIHYGFPCDVVSYVQETFWNSVVPMSELQICRGGEMEWQQIF